MARPEDSNRPLLSIIIPAYNEAANVKRGVLQEVAGFLSDQAIDHEVIVVDDGSDDDTVAQVEALLPALPSVSLKKNPHGGKAQAVTAGVLAASGRYVLFMDMDLATSLSHIPQFLAALEAGADAVIASREMKGAQRVGTPFLRRLLARGFNLLVRTLLLPGLSDTQCGFKAFRREIAQDLFRSLQVFRGSGQEVKGPQVTSFDVELLVLARQRGYSVKEMPVTWHHVETKRVNPLGDALRMFREVMAVWRAKRQGRYDQ